MRKTYKVVFCARYVLLSKRYFCESAEEAERLFEKDEELEDVEVEDLDPCDVRDPVKVREGL